MVVNKLSARLASLRAYTVLIFSSTNPNTAQTAEVSVLSESYHHAMRTSKHTLTESEVSRVVEMAWEDRTPFEVIEATFGLSESETIKLMRREMKASSFRLWRKRVTGRVTKHRKLRGFDVGRGYCPTQYKR